MTGKVHNYKGPIGQNTIYEETVVIIAGCVDISAWKTLRSIMCLAHQELGRGLIFKVSDIMHIYIIMLTMSAHVEHVKILSCTMHSRLQRVKSACFIYASISSMAWANG